MMKKYMLAISMISLLAITGCSEKEVNKEKVTEKASEKVTENASEKLELDKIIKDIYSVKSPEFKTIEEKIDITDKDILKNATGLDDATKLSEVYKSEPMMSSQAYSMVLVKTKNAEDTKEIANEMLKNIDPAKWICVCADDIKIVSSGDIILLIMLSSDFSDMITSDDIVSTFEKTIGKEVDLKLSK
jgi:hypothetical protein